MSEPVKIDPGPRPELAYLPVDRLDVDSAYQRSLDGRASRKMIARIADNFRWSSFQAILVTPNGRERWLIIDGQHRVEAAKLNAISLVPAVVIHEISGAEQASAFVAANKDRVPMQAQHLFHARLVAGDLEARTVKRICDEAGIALYRHNIAAQQFAPGKTAATPSLLRSLSVYGEAVTAVSVRALADCFGRFAGALRGPYFLAAARYLSEGGDENALRRAISLLGPDRLAADARGRGSGGKSGSPELVALIRSQANAGDSAATPGGIAAGVDPASRLAGGRTPAPAQVPSLGGAALAEAAAPMSPGAAGVLPSAARVPDKSEDNGTLQSKAARGFQDDPRANPGALGPQEPRPRRRFA